MGCITTRAYKRLPPLTEAQQFRVTQHYGLVHAVFQKELPARHKFNRGIRDDLIQEGIVALAKASQQFDETLGMQFSTYAWPAILRRMARYLVQNCKTYKVPIATMMRDVYGLPGEVSIDAWGEQLLGAYRDPIIMLFENFDDAEINEALPECAKAPVPTNEVEVQVAKRWLEQNASQTDRFVTQAGTSHAQKRLVERDVGHSISNAAYIEAATQLGYAKRPAKTDSSKNYFNFRLRRHTTFVPEATTTQSHKGDGNMEAETNMQSVDTLDKPVESKSTPPSMRQGSKLSRDFKSRDFPSRDRQRPVGIFEFGVYGNNVTYNASSVRLLEDPVLTWAFYTLHNCISNEIADLDFSCPVTYSHDVCIEVYREGNAILYFAQGLNLNMPANLFVICSRAWTVIEGVAKNFTRLHLRLWEEDKLAKTGVSDSAPVEKVEDDPAAIRTQNINLMIVQLHRLKSFMTAGQMKWWANICVHFETHSKLSDKQLRVLESIYKNLDEKSKVGIN